MDVYVTSTCESTQFGSISDSDSPIKEKSSTASLSAGQESDPSADMSDDIELPQLSKSQGEIGAQLAVFDDGANGELVHVTALLVDPLLWPTHSSRTSTSNRSRTTRKRDSSTLRPAQLVRRRPRRVSRLLKDGVDLELVEDCFTW